jgi:hypothetical protein
MTVQKPPMLDFLFVSRERDWWSQDVDQLPEIYRSLGPSMESRINFPLTVFVRSAHRPSRISWILANMVEKTNCMEWGYPEMSYSQSCQDNKIRNRLFEKAIVNDVFPP